MTADLAEFVCRQLAGDRVRRMFGGGAVYRGRIAPDSPERGGDLRHVRSP